MSSIKKIKQQEYLKLCKTKDNVFNKTHAYFKENKYYLYSHRDFANQCLIACIQSDNWNDFYHVFDDLIILCNDCDVEKCLKEKHLGQTQRWSGFQDNDYNIPLHYMLYLTCKMEYKHSLQKICQRMKKLGFKCIPSVIQCCFRVAKYNRFENILIELATYFSKLVHVICDLNGHKFFYYTEIKENIQQIQRQFNQLFMLWLISDNSPKQDSIWFQLPRDISRYIIQQFI